jgi:aminoglycoside 3-N-acetyltransferase
MENVTRKAIADGLRQLGLDRTCEVLVHSSLSSFGYVDGGAEAVCTALTEVCGTVLMPAGSWDLTGVPAPPGLVRPHNAYWNAESWPDFDEKLSQATSFRPDLPIDKWLGTVPETFRQTCSPFTRTSPARSSAPTTPPAAAPPHCSNAWRCSADVDQDLADDALLDGGVGGSRLVEGVVVQGDPGFRADPDGA